MNIAGTIDISNVKGIQSLKFELPKNGLYLLCGTNGAGKSSILACAHRIGFSNAFAMSFKSSGTKNLDDFADSRIEYTAGKKTVAYIYGGHRWTPRPRKNASVLAEFGFPSVHYIAANANRIEPRPEEFKPKNIRDASLYIRENSSYILDSPRFKDLKIFNVTQGLSLAFLLPAIPRKGSPKASFFSEKNFSLGELCVLKLLREVENCKANSLLLIDEIELALHPLAQVRLLSVLEKAAEKKNLTVIVATHSVSLINAVHRNKILQLCRDGESITCIQGPYHAAAIGSVSSLDPAAVDYVFVVEDECAATVVRAIARKLSHTLVSHKQPDFRVIPLGTYESALQFTKNSTVFLPNTAKVWSVLDGDAKASIESWAEKKDPTKLTLLNSLAGKIHYLPWTPELGFASLIFNNEAFHTQSIRKQFGNVNRLTLYPDELRELLNLADGKGKRDAAKAWLAKVIQHVCTTTAENPQVVRDRLLTYFGESVSDENEIKRLFMPLLRSEQVLQ